MLSPRRSRPPSIRDEHATYSRWTGQFVDRSVEKVYRELQFAQDRAQALAVFGALGTVWCALTVFSWFYQDELIALIRLLVLCLFPVFLWRLDTPERFDQRVFGLFCVGWVGVPLVLWLGSTPTPYVLMWMGVFLLGTTTWGVLPVPFLAVSHLVAISTMSVVVLSRGESVARVAALGASLFSCSLAFAVTSSLRARRLQAAVWRSEALVEDRELLLAAVAHQLRTPLAATLMALEVARQAPERADVLYQRMRVRLVGLSDLIDALLDFGGLADGRLPDLTPFSVGPVLETVAEELGALWGGEMRHHGDGRVLGDASLFRSALMAVAGNATRFAAAEVRMLVEVEQTLRIHVDDDGPGVPPDQWDAIFEPLAQVDPQAPHSGIGMGLAIATRIVEAHGGVLFVSDSPLGGARFTIELPVA